VLPIQIRFRDIVEVVHSKYPNADSALALKYRDPEGDLMTVASRADLRSALASAAGPG
jgi:hypothetical protein